ncbi:unnamed protein product [Psylliodes chrysocephalus]|uniref:Uncharacterized protein n=1 Tax=Psylliodes chrysocephalus TaxID=3402493 RepID=A0A9P0CQU1_9CUCU|nr:unnamed protein product [Psylliodes chrysocephala]
MNLTFSEYYYNMMDVRDQIGFFVLLGLVIFLVFLIRKFIKVKRAQFKREVERSLQESHQQEDIYNISSRVQDQWPTHDAHLSIDHISILNQMNKSMYNDAPPSYDEVMKTAIQTNGEASTPTAVIVEAPKAISTTTSLRQQ